MRLDGYVLDVRDTEFALDDGGALFPRALHVSLANFEVVGNVSSRFGEDEVGDLVVFQVRVDERRFGRCAVFGVEDRFQRFVFHLDQGKRLFGHFLADSGHAHYSFAHKARAIPGEDVLVFQVQANVTGEIVAGDNRFHAGQRFRFAHVNGLDEGVRVRAAFDAGVE